MKVVEVAISDITKENLDNTGVFAVSIVKNPAIERNFFKFGKEEKKPERLFFNDEKRIITGAALIPDLKIYRNNLGNGEDGYVYFSKETIKEIAEKFFIDLTPVQSTTLEHKDSTDKLNLIESWIIEDETYDKAYKFDKDLPVGTWMLSYKVTDDDLWNEIKDGTYNGFSVEASLNLLFSEQKQTDSIESVINELKSFIENL